MILFDKTMSGEFFVSSKVNDEWRVVRCPCYIIFTHITIPIRRDCLVLYNKACSLVER